MGISRELGWQAVHELEGASPFTRFVVGLGALLAALPLGAAGAALSFRALEGLLARGIDLAIVRALSLGTGLVVVTVFFGLVWVRMWFGSRRWVNAALAALFARAYIGLIVAVVALLCLAATILRL